MHSIIHVHIQTYRTRIGKTETATETTHARRNDRNIHTYIHTLRFTYW